MKDKIIGCCCCSVTKLCPTLCDPMDCSTPGFPVFHCLRVCSDLCPVTQWCHPNISSSVTPFSSCPQSFPASGCFPTSCLFALGGQRIKASTLASVLPINIQDWFPLGLIGVISLLSKGLWRVFSSTEKIKSVTVSTFSPSFCHEVMGLDAVIFFFFFFWVLSFKQVIGKKWIYLERNTLHRQSVGHLRRWETEIWHHLFFGLGNFIGKWVEGLFQLFRGRGRDFQELGHHSLFWVGLRIVMVLMSVLFNILMYYNENTLRLKAHWESNILPSWT